jgi:hypothetical protein
MSNYTWLNKNVWVRRHQLLAPICNVILVSVDYNVHLNCQTLPYHLNAGFDLNGKSMQNCYVFTLFEIACLKRWQLRSLHGNTLPCILFPVLLMYPTGSISAPKFFAHKTRFSSDLKFRNFCQFLILLWDAENWKQNIYTLISELFGLSSSHGYSSSHKITWYARCADLFSNPALPGWYFEELFQDLFRSTLNVHGTRQLVSNFFTINPDEAVAYGAAVLAAIILLFSSSTLPVFPSVSRLLDLSWQFSSC